MPIATGVNGTLKINEQTRIQNEQFKTRSEGLTSKGAANYASIKTMFPNSPVHLANLNENLAEDRGRYLSAVGEYKSMFASVIDGSVVNGYGFEAETVYLNYENSDAPVILETGYVEIDKELDLSDSPPLIGTPNTSVLKRTLSSPETKEIVATKYSSNDGFGIKVQVERTNDKKAPGDTIGKYFSKTLSDRPE
jgi:hypothetical protein